MEKRAIAIGLRDIIIVDHFSPVILIRDSLLISSESCVVIRRVYVVSDEIDAGMSKFAVVSRAHDANTKKIKYDTLAADSKVI